MKSTPYFIIDFDSTFIKVEAFDLLVDIALKDHSQKESVRDHITKITRCAMEGSMPFKESLEKRMALLPLHRDHITELVVLLHKKVSPSFQRNREFFKEHAKQIYIISNGFHAFIDPIVMSFGIKKENIFANVFRFDKNGKIIGFETQNPLVSNQGKTKILKELNLPGDVYVIGDGYTDYEIKSSGLANKFFAFTENVERKNIVDKADHITPNLDEFLFLNRLKASVSYPKNRIRILLLENVDVTAVHKLQEEGFNVEVSPAGLSEEDLIKKIGTISILGIRSKTRVTANVLKKAHRLMAIGAFCIGTNQIDLEAASKKGVAVFNAPFSNTRSVVELVIAEIIMLVRNLPDKLGNMHRGKWNKSAKGSSEIRGKKLGIIGYGNIGTQLSILAEGLGMKVCFYDTEEKLALGNAIPCRNLKEVLTSSDVISLHINERSSNRNMIGTKEFQQMKKGVVFLNLSRSSVVDVHALREAVLNGTVSGCGVDVFPEEPLHHDDAFHSELMGLPNTILTPHIGGSTVEAQKNIAHFISERLIDYINTGSTKQSVNFPNLGPPELKNAHRLIHIHHNVPGVLAQINLTLARHQTNIVGQHLKTHEEIGYVITDVDKKYDEELIREMSLIQHTIKLRILY